MKKSIVLVLLLVSGVIMAQKTEVLAGSFENLKGITEYNLVFDYNGLIVDGIPEDEFLNYRIKEQDYKNSLEENAKLFKANWHSYKESHFAPKFIASFNKRFDGKVKADRNLTTAKYTGTVKATYMHPGYAGSGDSPVTNATLTITETANPANVLLVYTFTMEKNVPKELFYGSYAHDAGKIIGENYSKFAKMFAADLKKVQ